MTHNTGLWGPSRIYLCDPDVNKMFDEKLEEIEQVGENQQILDSICPSPLPALLSENEDGDVNNVLNTEMDNLTLTDASNETLTILGDFDDLITILSTSEENNQGDIKSDFEKKIHEAVRIVNRNIGDAHILELANFVWKALEGLDQLNGIKCEQIE